MKPARVVLIDDPTPYRNRHAERRDGAKSRFGYGVAARYSLGVMTEADLISLGPLIRAICAPDAYVFAWATRPNLDMALRIMAGRGLEYKTGPFTWVKTTPKGRLFKGPGRYNFSNPEDVLLGRWPGSRLWHPKTGWKPPSVFEEPHPRDPLTRRIIHSRKPRAFHDAIHQWLSPYIGDHAFVELFATRETPGWVCLGHDVTGRDIREDLGAYAAQMHGQQGSLFDEVTA